MAQDKQADGGRAARMVVQKLESLQRAGVTHVGKPPAPAPAVPAAVAKDVPPPPAEVVAGADPAEVKRRAAELDEVRREVAACTRCSELVGNRTQTVFGAGNPRARLVFLGEAPGADEDRQGEPFVGRAGQLLDRIIEACTMKREEVYIMNILRCRPPENRNPLPTEAAACREYLDRQLAIIQPEFICCLGSVAAQNLLDTTAPIGRLRGKFHEYGNIFQTTRSIKVLCTYHPAYLLRNPAAKRQVWEDMQLLVAEMGIELPRR